MGVTGKTPAWRVGCWLAGVALLAVVPLGRGRQGLVETAVVLVVGLVLTAPHALSRLAGAGPYLAPESPVRLRPVGVLTYLLYSVLVRVPVWLGDVLYTALWRALGQSRGRRGRPAASDVAVLPAPYGHDEPTWPPLGLLPGEVPERRGRVGEAFRRAAGRPRR
jgi:hypothetical protein